MMNRLMNKFVGLSDSSLSLSDDPAELTIQSWYPSADQLKLLRHPVTCPVSWSMAYTTPWALEEQE